MKIIGLILLVITFFIALWGARTTLDSPRHYDKKKVVWIVVADIVGMYVGLLLLTSDHIVSARFLFAFISISTLLVLGLTWFRRKFFGH
jgi:uncharacterized membrane protein HdeD (DUF308 family)